MSRVVLIEDELNMRRILCDLLTEAGHEVISGGTVGEARRLLRGHPMDLLITDFRLTDGDGLAVLALAREIDAVVPVILLTAYATIELAVQAMKQGAFDFITKPFDPDAVQAAVKRALNHGGLRRKNQQLQEAVRRMSRGNELVGESGAMGQVRDYIARVAPTPATVLISGETGTGKELVARAIHAASPRAAQPFVAINCAALPESLLDSELFGHEKGSFTGADRMRQGLFEAAHGGTLFLDEAAEMPLPLQAKLLRVLMERQVMRIGSTVTRDVDVRIVTATHRDLRQQMEEGLFREDLYFRLAVVPLEVPPLRARREDVPLLTHCFLHRVAGELNMATRDISPDAMAALSAYDFPGNIRELRNLIERACILSRADRLERCDFPPEVSGRTEPDGSPSHLEERIEQWVRSLPPILDLRETLEEVERLCLERALREANGVQAVAARRLGISRSDMHYRLKKRHA